MIEVAFRKILTANAAVSPLVGDRVYFMTRPQDDRRAAIVMSLVTATPAMNFSGRAGYVNGRMQVNCLAPTYPQAKALAQAAHDALDGYTGTQDGTVIAYIESQSLRDIPVLPLQGAGLPATFGVSLDALFMAKE